MQVLPSRLCHLFTRLWEASPPQKREQLLCLLGPLCPPGGWPFRFHWPLPDDHSEEHALPLDHPVAT